MIQPSPFLRFVEDDLQIAALLFMAVVYAFKIRWILKFPAGGDRQAARGDAQRGARRSLWSVAEPWAMASTRQHPLLYAQFLVFHLAVAASIAMSFVVPYAPSWLSPPGVVPALQGLFAAACAAGLYRLGRRILNPYLRSISSPDDYFSLALLIVWLALSVPAAPNTREGPLAAYFILTAFFLVYVPFSKISHYIYYPFARWYLGRTLGHRGVYPVLRGA